MLKRSNALLEATTTPRVQWRVLSAAMLRDAYSYKSGNPTSGMKKEEVIVALEAILENEDADQISDDESEDEN